MRKVSSLLLMVTVFTAFAFSSTCTSKETANNIGLSNTAVVELKETPSTGYLWHFEIFGSDTVEFQSRVVEPSSESTAMGAPIKVRWNFKPLKKGKATIIFWLYRSWEGKEKAIDLRVFNIVVKKNEEVPGERLLEDCSYVVYSGDEITVELEENPSTGYFWCFSNSNPEILSLSEELIVKSGKLPGEPSVKEWKFKTINPGICLLAFQLKRSSEEQSIEERFVGIRVKTGKERTEIKELKKGTNALNIGETAVLSLEENASTGFTWHLSLSHEGIVEILSKTITTQAPPGLVGAPSKVSWFIKGIKAGRVKLTLKKYRTWEGEDSAIEILKYSIEVR
ncbi:protease inhibitor I42 family protein [Kosmotoga pacifica]|uniref:Proteinase inhibitor I42 chagasin domain-containing protein n=1 Tax=Kosmotoga pacifica TaxID=1330330 RepID=A0A0G2ZC47_9BACT|nr:protease inhibitor I42 family protein [Kosmotoga pacifica]AKI97656.1 hypothetical protein IX53_07320 [Kosmotoga pacifica]